MERKLKKWVSLLMFILFVLALGTSLRTTNIYVFVLASIVTALTGWVFLNY